jgi:hypothetical protein
MAFPYECTIKDSGGYDATFVSYTNGNPPVKVDGHTLSGGTSKQLGLDYETNNPVEVYMQEGPSMWSGTVNAGDEIRCDGISMDWNVYLNGKKVAHGK